MEPTSGSAPTSSPTRSGTEHAAPPEQSVRTGTYEIMVIVPATIPEEQVPDASAKVVQMLTEHGAKIVEEKDFGKRKLAFPIKHARQGYYHWYAFEAPRGAVRKLDVAFRLMPEVLRHLIVTRRVRTQEQLEEEAALRERIQAKRVALEERAVADRQAKEAALITERKPEPVREVSKKELEEKLEEILTDETLGE